MHHVIAELTALCQHRGYAYQLHSLPSAIAIYETVETNYSFPHTHRPLWEKLAEHTSVYSPVAWQWVAGFIQNRPVFLFVEPQEKGEILELTNGANLVPLLGESTGFVFYLTNQQISYLLAYNDHHFLIGAGEAINWINSLSTELPQTV